MVSIAQQIKNLQQDIDDIIAGYYTQPTALGPNTLSKNSIKSRSIRSGNIDVSNLAAVQTKTGSLSVDGNLTIGTGGSLRSGKTDYSDVANAGFWMGIDSTVAKIRVGNIGHTSGFTWDGTTLSITGSVTATSGTIGGWTISSTDLSADSGAIGMASSGSIRFWSGHTTPSSAPFRVSSAGALTSTSGSIGGWTIDSTGIRLGSGATSRGMDSGSTAFYAGSATPSSAPFRVTTAGAVTASNLTVTGGSITASSIDTGTLNFGSNGTVNTGGSVTGTIGNASGTLNLGALTVTGTITMGSGGKIIDADGSYWDQSGLVLVSSGAYGDAIRWRTSGTDKASIYTDASNLWMFYGTSGSPGSYLNCSSSAAVMSTQSNGSVIVNSTGVATNGKIYPGAGTGNGQTTYYIDGATSGLGIITNGIGIGGMLGISSGNTINFISPGTGGSAGNWSTGSLTGEAGYFNIQIAGTTYRVPFYANG